MNFGTRLHTILGASFGKQYLAAEKLHVSTAAVSNWVHSDKLPSRMSLRRLLATLRAAGVSDAELSALVRDWNVDREQRKHAPHPLVLGRSAAALELWDALIGFSAGDVPACWIREERQV